MKACLDNILREASNFLRVTSCNIFYFTKRHEEGTKNHEVFSGCKPVNHSWKRARFTYMFETTNPCNSSFNT